MIMIETMELHLLLKLLKYITYFFNILKLFYLYADIHFYNGTTSVCNHMSLYTEDQILDIGMCVDNGHHNYQGDNSFLN